MTLDDETEIAQRLRQLAEADLALEAPPALETRLRAAFREGRHAAPRRSRAWLFAALAASLALGASLVTRPAPTPVAPVVEGAVSESEAFVPLTYDDPLSDVDAVHVVRVALDRSTLASYGLPASGAGTATVDAELLVGQDGLARGIRFVNQ